MRKTKYKGEFVIYDSVTYLPKEWEKYVKELKEEYDEDIDKEAYYHFNSPLEYGKWMMKEESKSLAMNLIDAYILKDDDSMVYVWKFSSPKFAKRYAENCDGEIKSSVYVYEYFMDEY